MRITTDFFLVLYFCLISSAVLAQSENASRAAPPNVTVHIDDAVLEISPWRNKTYEYCLPYTYHGTPTIKATTKGKIEPVVTTTGSFQDSENKITVSVALSYSERKCEFKIDIRKLPKLDLFLCIGQSNMAGRGPMDEAKGDLEPIPGVYLFTTDQNWETAANPLNKYSNVRKEMRMQQIGPAYAFAQTLSTALPKSGVKTPIGLVVNALGGSSIEQWQKGNTKEPMLYAKTMERAKEARKWGKFRAVVWHQGESNSSRSSRYPAQLKRLIADLRKDLGDDTLFFVAGEIARWRKNDKGEDPNAAFNAMIVGLRGEIGHFDVVSTADLKPLGGNPKDPHFDREGNLALGVRYGISVLENVYEKGRK